MLIMTSCGTKQPVTVKAVTEKSYYRAGDIVNTLFEYSMRDGWHIYWVNPGDAGLATEIDWNLPSTYGDVYYQYSIPNKYVSSDIGDYGYKPKAKIISSFRLPKVLPKDTIINLTITAKWLRCREICVPGADTLNKQININEEKSMKAKTKFNLDKLLQSEFPYDSDNWLVHFNRTDSSVLFTVSPKNGDMMSISKIEFYPETEGIFSNHQKQVLSKINNEFVLEVKLDPFRFAEPTHFRGIFVADKPWEENKSRAINYFIHID